jgi:antitoxin component YwqK of YwqJK toxin-antitoxin module
MVQKKSLRSILIIFSFIWVFSGSINCQKNSKPKTIPENSIYDKKTNTFTSVSNNQKKMWTEKGELIAEIELDPNGMEHGKAKYYHPITKSILNEGNWNQNNREGIWIWYFPNGNIYYRMGYSSTKQRTVWIQTNLLGNEDGVYERYYPNGKIEETGFYDGGLKDGVWKKYYLNGNLEYSGEFQKDKKKGTWYYYYPNGQIEILEIYDDYQKMITRKTFFEDGKINCKIHSKIDFQCNEI